MTRRIDQSLKTAAKARNSAARRRRFVTMGKRARISGSALRGPYLPPETWYEVDEDHPSGDYTVVVQESGCGFRHVLSEGDVRSRLAQLPAWMVEPLHVVQFSQMTRKKRRSPCYGMQWGSTIYLYPIEQNLIETFLQPPKPAQRIEADMYGGRWEPAEGGRWKLVWTEAAIRDFYLNNVLIHELGHILDGRNSSHRDRERFAEWFAVEMGYKPTRRTELAAKAVSKYVVKRHSK
jgi:hypothetical protein